MICIQLSIQKSLPYYRETVLDEFEHVTRLPGFYIEWPRRLKNQLSYRPLAGVNPQ